MTPAKRLTFDQQLVLWDALVAYQEELFARRKSEADERIPEIDERLGTVNSLFSAFPFPGRPGVSGNG